MMQRVVGDHQINAGGLELERFDRMRQYLDVFDAVTSDLGFQYPYRRGAKGSRLSV